MIGFKTFLVKLKPLDLSWALIVPLVVLAQSTPTCKISATAFTSFGCRVIVWEPIPGAVADVAGAVVDVGAVADVAASADVVEKAEDDGAVVMGATEGWAAARELRTVVAATDTAAGGGGAVAARGGTAGEAGGAVVCHTNGSGQHIIDLQLPVAPGRTAQGSCVAV